MAKQLVLSGNRVIAHGEDCFMCMGGTVVCRKTGRKFDNATVATYTCACPSDIDEVGYEYRAGEFVPCTGREITRWVTLADVRYDNNASYSTLTLALSESLNKYSQFAVLSFLGCNYAGNDYYYQSRSGEIKIDGVSVSSYSGEYCNGPFYESGFESLCQQYTRFTTQLFPVIYTVDGVKTIIATSGSDTGANVTGDLKSISIVFAQGNMNIFRGARFIVIAR